LHIPAALCVGAGELMIPAEDMCSKHNFKVMLLKKTDSSVNFFEGNAPRRGNNTYLVAFNQVGGVDHVPKVHKMGEINVSHLRKNPYTTNNAAFQNRDISYLCASLFANYKILIP